MQFFHYLIFVTEIVKPVYFFKQTKNIPNIPSKVQYEEEESYFILKLKILLISP